MAKKALLSRLIHEELEPRLLFSAGLETVLLGDNLPGTEQAIVETISENETEILQLEQNQQANSESEPASEVVFIDENVEDYDQLMADLANKDNIDVYILDSSVDGIEQISAVLANYEGLDAIHLISHGNDEGLLLGNGTLDNSNIDSYTNAISGWQSALSEQADLLIYGCDIAASEQGLALLETLNSLTGTDIAASDNLTGHTSLGGDWELEYQAGAIETSLVFSDQLQQDWVGVLPPNTAPVNTVPGAQITNENVAIIFKNDNSNLISVSDADAGGAAIQVSLSVNNGTLTLDGTTGLSFTIGDGTSDVAMTFTGTIADINDALSSMSYTPTGGWSGTDTLTISTDDLGNTGGPGPLTDTDTVNITVNAAPTAVNNTVTATEDTTLTLTAAHFNYSDGDGDPMASVKITSLESAGSLQLSGVDVTLNQVISKADIDAGNLKFVPVANANGAGYDSFGFSVNDGTVDSAASYTMTMDVTAQNDAPTAAGNTVTTNEDTSYTFGAADFNFTDVDGDSISSIKVTTLEGVGSLQLSGADVTLNQVISKADIDAGNLTFTPVANANGAGYDSFDFSVNDGTVDSAASYTMTMDVTAVNDAPTGGVSITGTVTEDQTLTADTSALADADGLGAFSYTWQRDGVDIGGATASTYTLTDADVGAAITVTTNYTDGNGTAESVVSAATAAVANVNDSPTGGVSITGTVIEDQILTADTSALADADGLGAFSYQWQRDGVDIGGATASTYTLAEADVGAAITVKTSYTDANGTAENVTSGATAAVANVNDTPTGGVSITGTVTEDQILTADTSALADADGLGAFSYQWQRDGVDIGGATASTYTLADTDVGAAITVKTSYIDGQGTAENVTSSATAAVAKVSSNSPTTNSTNEDTTFDYTIDPIVTEVSPPELQPDKTIDSSVQEEAVNEETDETEESPTETDVVVDVDAEGKPTVLSKQGASELLHSLTTNQANSGADEVTYISPADLAEEENVLIESVSPWQLDGQGFNLDLQQALDELNQHLGSNGHAEESDGQIIVTTAAGVSIGLTAGFVTWALQGSSLLTALLTTLPAWNTFDPLPVLDAKNDKKKSKLDKEKHDGVDSVFEDVTPDSDNQ